MERLRTDSAQGKLSLEECQNLGRRCSEGDLDAREQLILSHTYLVKQVMFEFLNRGVEAEDLFQEGCYGLLKAVDRYDYTRGILFSTYAVYWIRQRMRDAMRVQSVEAPIVLNERDFTLFMKISYKREQLKKELGREPTYKEVADSMNIKEEHVRNLWRFGEPFFYIDNPLSVEPQASSSPSAEEDFFTKVFFMASDILTPQERKILSRRLGLTYEGREQSYKEIADTMNLSAESIRLHYHSAFKKVKQYLLDNYNEV